MKEKLKTEIDIEHERMLNEVKKIEALRTSLLGKQLSLKQSHKMGGMTSTMNGTGTSISWPGGSQPVWAEFKKASKEDEVIEYLKSLGVRNVGEEVARALKLSSTYIGPVRKQKKKYKKIKLDI